MQLTLDIPDSLAHRLLHSVDRDRRVREALIIEAFLDGVLTRGQLGDLLELNFYETEAWLK